MYLENFQDLRKLYKISRQRAISHAELVEVARLSKQFLVNFERLYYRGDERRIRVCTINIHSIIHLCRSPLRNLHTLTTAAQYLRDLDPASVFDAVPMERAIEVMKEQVRGMGDIGANLSNSVLMWDLLNYAPIRESLVREREKHVRSCIKGEVLKRCLVHFKRNFAQYDIEAYKLRFFKRGRTDYGKLIGLCLSQRDNETNRDDFRVCWWDAELRGKKYGDVEYFCEAREYEDMAVVRAYKYVIVHDEWDFVTIEERSLGCSIYIGTNTILGLVGKLTDVWTEGGRTQKQVYLVGEMDRGSGVGNTRSEVGYWENEYGGWGEEGADDISLQRWQGLSGQDDVII